SSLAATGGTLVETLSAGGRIYAYVDCTISALATTVVSVFPLTPNNSGVGGSLRPSARLHPPTPHPLRPLASPRAIRYALARPGVVRVSVVDISGRRVANLFQGSQFAGPHAATWDGREDGGAVSSGIYFVLVESENGTASRRIAVIR